MVLSLILIITVRIGQVNLTSHLQQLTRSCTFLLLVTTSSLSIFSVMYSMSMPERSNAEEECADEDEDKDEDDANI